MTFHQILTPICSPDASFSSILSLFPLVNASRNLEHGSHTQLNADDSTPYIWPLPSEFSFGNQTLAVDPNLSLVVSGNGGGSAIVNEAFERYKLIIFKHHSELSNFGRSYDIEKLNLIVHSANEELQLGVDESYSLLVAKRDEHSIIGEITIEASSVYGSLRGLETLSQLCAFDYGTKTVPSVQSTVVHPGQAKI
ncbi:unnamed protein product [Fraxinus pennsylvanica]|uniref:Beta-hexosaminidase eukaryotic type N-terminal domain-containing protein n=1 Tax=Fraxinus pennsylvanica TaxID=56036 RepID=A0AAD1ZVM8_9LAMI|nr:unnamed protein product [Fraxinus pennsylvanica]